MKQAVLSNWDIPWLPIAALMMFFICFGVFTYWTFRQQNKKMYEDISLIPLQDKEKL